MDQETLTLIKGALGPGGRMESLEQRMKGLGSGSDAVDAIKKVLLSGGNPKMVHGWGGDGAAQLLPFCGRAKSVGHGTGDNKTGTFGEWLQDVASACLGGTVPEFRKPLDKTMARLKAFDSDWDRRQVSKVPNAEGTGSAGGYLVPTQFYMKLLQFVAERSFVKALCTTLPMEGRELKFPYLNQQGTTASSAAFPSSNFFGGVYFTWAPEAATLSQTNPEFKQGTLVARDLCGITIVSNQLIQDSAIALDSLLTTMFADSLAWQLDYAFLRGNGVNQPLGILNAPGTIAVSRAASNALLTTMSDMVGRIVNPNTDQGNYVWIITQSMLPYLLRLVTSSTTGFLAWLNPAPQTQDEGPMARPWPVKIFGIPVYVTEKLPAYATQGDACLVDLSKYLCGDRMSIQVEASQFPYFTSNQTVWRTIWRGDGQPWFNAPMTLGDGTTTVSPHVIIAT